MSFGNRPSGPNSRPPRRMGGGFDPSHIKVKQQGFDWGGLVTGLAWVVIIISVGVIAYTQFSGSQPSPSEPKKQRLAIFAGEPVAKARNYKKTGKAEGGWMPIATVSMPVNRTETGLDAIDSELHERCTKRTDKSAASWSIERGEARFHVKDTAKFLTCTMKHQRSRFCKPYYRKRLAERIIAYVKVHNKITRTFGAEMKKQLTPQAIAATKRMKQAEREMRQFEDSVMHFAKDKRSREFGRQERNRAPTAFTGISSGFTILGPMIPKDFGRTIRSLSQMGLLNAEDFNSWISKAPKEVLPYLADVPSPC